MATGIVTTVCTMRRPSDAADCLSALTAQIPANRLAIVASALTEGEIAEYRAAIDAAVLVEPRPGLSRARNRALAWAVEQRADVLAFVDDDAIAAESWASALERAWAAAPARVACIGGPIRPRFSVEPPAWFSNGIAHTLTLLDRGPATRDLEPDEEAVYGANISFRVEALRRIGGFDPALGHSGGRVFFAEEDEAQRALARLGYGVRYVPDAAVLHVIPPQRLTRSSFLRRRFAFGAALGLRGGRGRGEALGRAAVSTAGAVAAAATCKQALAMERAVRAAENAGVVLSRLYRRGA
jgi:GT2 family glycosyltransferase